MDETPVPVLDPGRGRTKTGYLWVLARDDRGWSGNDPPGIVYHYGPGRSGKHAEQLPQGFDGILQVDGYGGYNRLTKPERTRRRTAGPGILLDACAPPVEGDLRPRRLDHRRRGPGPDRRALPHRSRDPRPPERRTPGRPRDPLSTAGRSLRPVAQGATRPRLAQIPQRRKADLHRQPLGRPLGLP